MKRFAALFCLVVLAACNTTQQGVPTPTTVSLEDVPNLDANQIHALSEAQIEALGAENQVLLEANKVEPSTRTAIRYPNYNDTLYLATSISYETYLSSYYRQTSGPDWSDDGCSGPTPPVIFDTNACRQHDFGYRNVPKYGAGRNETVRKSIDSRFLSNMYLKCDRYWNHWYQVPLKVACKADALVFYGGVRNFGQSAYYATRQVF